MASTVHLWLEIAGRRVEGDSTVSSMDRKDTIECYTYHHELKVPHDVGFSPTGKRLHSTVTITKPIDRSTPLLMLAVCDKQAVDEALFRFYRPSENGGEEQFYSVELVGGFVASVTQSSENDVIAGEQSPPAMETVSFTFERITWTYELTGATHQDIVAGMV